MDKSEWKGDAPLFNRLEVLETLDAQSRILKGTVLPSGAANTVGALTWQAAALLSSCNY